MGNVFPPQQQAVSEVGKIFAATASHNYSRECSGYFGTASDDVSSASESLSWLEANDLETLTILEHELAPKCETSYEPIQCRTRTHFRLARSKPRVQRQITYMMLLGPLAYQIV